MFEKPWTGILPATLCPFNDDDSTDEIGLRENDLLQDVAKRNLVGSEPSRIAYYILRQS